MRPLFFFQFALVVSLLAAHVLIVQHELYWRFIWLDVPMHFLGGIWAGLFSVWALRLFLPRAPFLAGIAGIIAIGIGWELLEFAIGFQREANFLFDTSLDLLMDVIGGIAGIACAKSFFVHDTIVAHGTENHPS